MMGALEEGGKAVGVIAQSMQSTPLALALLVVNASFIGFFAYLMSEVSANARARDATQSELVKTLIDSCGNKPKPSLLFRSIQRREPPPATETTVPATPEK